MNARSFREHAKIILKILRIRNVYLHIIANVILSFCFSVYSWILPILMSRFGIYFTGSIYSIVNIASIFFPALFGVFADIYGRKLALIISNFISVLVFGILAYLWNNPLALVSVVLLETLDIAFFHSASRSFLAESIENEGLKDFLGTAFSIAATFSIISTSIGSLIGGILINVLGYTETFTIFLIMSIISLIIRLFYRETLKEREISIQFKNIIQPLKHLKEIINLKSMSLIIAYVLIVSLISNISNIYIPIFMEKILKMNKILIGLSYCLMDLLSSILQPIAGKFVDEFGSLCGMMMMHIIAAPMIIAFANSINPLYAIVFISISSSASTFYYAGYPTLIAKITKSEVRSTVYGVLISIMKIGAIPGPILGALLWSFDPKMTFYFTAILDMLAIIVLTVLRTEVGKI